MNIIWIIQLLKFGLHQFLLFNHIFNNPISRINNGSEGIQNYVILIVGIILRLGVTQGSSKCLALPKSPASPKVWLLQYLETQVMGREVKHSGTIERKGGKHPWWNVPSQGKEKL